MRYREIAIADTPRALDQPRRLLFRYYKDRYAAMLLERQLRPYQYIRDLRAGPFARLLDRPAIKAVVAAKGGGLLHRDDLALLWPCETETYVVTFARWGSEKSRDRRWNQTSRPRRQLVLQLNFPHAHDVEYHRLIHDAKDMPFQCRYHPANWGERITMAWARIDIDVQSGEALIEEVQNDWIRNVRDNLAGAVEGWGRYTKPADIEKLRRYSETVLAPHAEMWSEAVLAAALQVLIGECGLSRVWYHHFTTGCEIKNLHKPFWKPPRSIYTELPKRFCFALTDEPPAFILYAQPRWLRKKLERREGRFWRMDVDHSLTFI
jgi:hypothetical protein